MKKSTNLIAGLLVAAAIFLGTNANAQTKPDSSKWRFGIGIEPGLPTGTAHQRSHFELGGTVRLQYDVSHSFALTLTSGYYNFFGIEQRNGLGKFPAFDVIPVEAGIKEFFVPNFYFGAEAGPAFPSTDNTRLVLAPALGYANESWDIGVRYENFSGYHNPYGIVSLRIAYAFKL